MMRAFKLGLLAVWRNPGLAVLVLVVNLSLAALLAVPLGLALEDDLRYREASTRMLYGFDFPFWDHWQQAQRGFVATFGPGLLGAGIFFRNAELALRGHLPLRLFDHGQPGAAPDVGSLILGVAFLYLLVWVFLSGGILGVLRSPEGGWRLRGLLHGSGFYFGRLLRLALLTLVLFGLAFALHAPFSAWAERQAQAAVSEYEALGWLLGRQVVLLVALALVFLVASYAKAIVVLEERSSALLALLSSLGFCARNPAAVVGHLVLVLLAGLALAQLWLGFDALWTTTGYKTQLVTLAAAQLFMLVRIGLRLALLGGQVALYRERSLAE